MHTSTVSFGLIYSLKTYFVRHIDAKEKLHLNFKLDEVLKVQTTHLTTKLPEWSSSGAQLPSLTQR